MKLLPEHYFRAALERMAQAHFLYRQANSFALTTYVAGLAVECMLRAFKLRKDPTFDERHDLRELFKASGLLHVDTDALVQKGLSAQEAEGHLRQMLTAVNEIYLLWSNGFRYASEERLRAHLKRTATYRMKLKGDILKATTLRLLNAAQVFIDKGVRLWTAS